MSLRYLLQLTSPQSVFPSNELKSYICAFPVFGLICCAPTINTDPS